MTLLKHLQIGVVVAGLSLTALPDTQATAQTVAASAAVTASPANATRYVRNTSPADNKLANWLPAPANEAFPLYLRAYWPQQPALDGGWTPLPIKREP